MSKRIWDKGEAVDELMHELTVGNDPELDRNLVCADAMGSAAHARMLESVGLLSAADCSALLTQLQQIYTLGQRGEFEIPRSLEDVHSAIESRLIETCNEAGRRIHTARSRNDQVLLAMRLFLRSKTLTDIETLITLSDTIAARFDELAAVPMPGYTHMQPAMPSSFGMWLHSWYEGLLELITEGNHVLDSLDSNPLGSGAGFGSSLRIDRTLVATLLGFSRVQRSFIDVNNSRGRYELRYVTWACEVGALLEKFACDVTLFATHEFGLLSLPAELTTGSSIMPQKRNPDLAELLRARCSRIRGPLFELQSVTAKLPSSYHRDLQYTKEPLFRAATELTSSLKMAGLLFARFTVNKQRTEQSMHDELYATYDACREVERGVPFRDAYRTTAERVKAKSLSVTDLTRDFELPQSETISGMNIARSELSKLRKAFGDRKAHILKQESAVFDFPKPK